MWPVISYWKTLWRNLPSFLVRRVFQGFSNSWCKSCFLKSKWLFEVRSFAGNEVNWTVHNNLTAKSKTKSTGRCFRNYWTCFVSEYSTTKVAYMVESWRYMVQVASNFIVSVYKTQTLRLRSCQPLSGSKQLTPINLDAACTTVYTAIVQLQCKVVQLLQENVAASRIVKLMI